jgi:microcystin-dependent protein
MDEFIGKIDLYPYSFTPMGMALCNGQILQVAQNNALYSLIGNTYGGTYGQTFAVPNMLGLEPVPGLNYYIITEGIFPVRD